MMKIRPILHELKFGGDVAENDANLDAYFVETSAFLDVINDEADLIIGPKGSGKTAILGELPILMLPFPNSKMLMSFQHSTYKDQ
jgi:hypothetical protein